MSNWTLHGFYVSSAKNGYTAVTPLADTLGVTVTNTNYLKVAYAGIISYMHVLTGAIANFVGARVRHNLNVNYCEVQAVDDQTGDRRNGGSRVNYDVPLQGLIHAEADNGNNAQVEAIYIAFGPSPSRLSLSPPDNLPRGYWIKGTGTTTQLANGVWKECALTWSGTQKPTARYKIHAMRVQSATAYAGRLVMREKETAGFRPGVPAGDTKGLNPAFWGDFPTFQGDMPPNVEMSSSGADTAQAVDLYISEA